MTRIHLNFYQRIMLWNLIGGFQAPNIRATLAFLELLKKIKPTDVEMMETQFVIEGVQYRWVLPHPNYGDRDLELESEESAAMVQALEGQQGVRIADAAWMFQLLDELKTEQISVAVSP